MNDTIVISFNGYYKLVGEEEIFENLTHYYKINPSDDFTQLLAEYKEFKKIAIVPYVFIADGTMEVAKEYAGENLNIDLGEFDQVVIISYEILMGPIDEHLVFLRKKYNNSNIRIVNTDTELASDRDHSSVFLYPIIMTDVWYTNQYRDTIKDLKPKLFDALLGINKEHRKFVFFNLYKSCLLKRSYVSLTSLSNETKSGKRRTWYYSTDLRQLESNDVKSNIKSDEPFSGYFLSGHSKPLSHQVPWNIYENSWYSIIAETHINILHTTEKLAKPLMAKRLFILFGAPYMLKRLHDLGFKTFSSIIDESYDSEINNETRWRMAFDQVVALSKLDPNEVYKQVSDVVEHNHRLALDKEYWFAPLRKWILDN